MVDQKSENFRTLAGNHGGLRRGTAAAALGAVLVLSAGVPASNAAAPALLTDAAEGVQSSPDPDAGSGTALEVSGTALEADPTVRQVRATADGTLSLEAWAGAILDDDEDDDESYASPAPTASPTRPSFSPSTTPVPAVPVPTLPATPLPTTSPAPAPAPSPSSTAVSGPSQTSAPAPTASRPGYSPAASVPAPATRQAPAAQQPPAAQPGAASELAPAIQPAPASQPAQAPAGAPAPATGPAAEAPDRSAKGKLDTATSRPGAAGITAGVWGSGRFSSPMNMGTVDSRYSVSRPSSAVLGSSQAGPVSPMVWAGAGLVLLAGAAGLVAYKLRRAL